VKDLVKAQELLAQGQEELDKWMHPQPLQCEFSIEYSDQTVLQKLTFLSHVY
jgi:hypothetical protein